jgi:hypothetical protein
MSDLTNLSEALRIVRRLPAIVNWIESVTHVDRRPYLWTRLDLDLRTLLYTLDHLDRLPGRRYVAPLTPEQYANVRDRYLTPLAAALAAQWRVPRPLREPLRALAAERGQDRDAVKVDAMREAVLLVLAERATPTRIDVRPWIGARPDGAVDPSEGVHILDFLRWWRRRVYQTAEDILADAGDVGATTPPAAVPATEPAEVPPDPDARVDAIYAAAKDDLDRRLLDAMAEHDSIADAARAIGITPATARKRKERLLERYKRIG